MQDYDKLTSFLGDWGPFQMAIFFLLSLTAVPNGYMGLSVVFLADTPPHFCRARSGNGSGSPINASLISSKLIDGSSALGSCTRLKWTGEGQVNETEECLDGWEFGKERYASTIVTEWNLVCSEAWKVPACTSVYFCGVLAGSMLSAQFSDRFGRKKTLFITLAMQTVCSLIQVASVNWLMFCILFFFVGFAQISKYISAFVLGNELLVKSIRITYSTLGVCVFYALGYAALPMFAYFIRDWRMLLLALSLPGVLYTPLWWLIPESPRWLLSQGEMEEAKAILHAAAQKNGVTPPEVIFTPDESLELMVLLQYFLSLSFTLTRNIRYLTALVCLIWMANTIGYYGISLNTSNMNGDPYITCFISAATEIAAYTIAWAILKHAPRRCVLSILLLLSGSLLLFIQFVPSELPILTIILAMTGKFGLTISTSVIYVYSSELFPTVVRNMGMGAASMFSGIGGITAPYFPYFGVYNKIVPYIIMGCLTLAMGFSSLLLPETETLPFPEKMEDVQPLRWYALQTLSHRKNSMVFVTLDANIFCIEQINTGYTKQ
uniref:Solute carrier family 22 member 5-like n=1 Tax=Erpetoichthys calabaricus TaxID=27687 RepID=A0A8C4RKB1_ERPCA